MSITNAPPRLIWHAQDFIASQVLTKIGPLQSLYGKYQIGELYKFAKKVSNRSNSVRVLDSGWATQDCLNDKNFQILTAELVEISKTFGSFMFDLALPLHWSRRYEYPYAIINSMLPEHPSRDFKILDCGASICPLQYYFATKGFEVYSLDLDLRRLEQVARFKSEKGLKSIHPVFGNILSLPFPDSYFDRVINISVLEHIVYRVKQDTNVILRGFVSELLRVLKPEGIIVLTFDVNMNPKKSDYRLYFHEYESLCRILGILPEPPPPNRLFSSDTKEGLKMAEDLCTYCAILGQD